MRHFSSISCLPVRCIYGSVPECRDGDERVNGDVGRRVGREADQLAGEVAERPVDGGVLMGHERRADDEEIEISHGQVQQQDVDVSPAAARWILLQQQQDVGG